MFVPFATALVHFLWQGIVLGGLAFVLLRGLRHASAATRYVAGFCVLACGPMALLGTTIALASAASPAGTPRIGSTPPWAWHHLVAGMWLCGVLGLSARTFVDALALIRLRATGLPLRAWHGRLADLRQRLGIRSRVALTESPAVASPMVTGWLRPMILLPLGLAARMPPQWVESILAHELAHIRRHDVLLGIVQRGIEVLLFFHPVVWWLSKEIRRLREEACDDLVVDALHSPIDYARALTELASLASPTPTLAMASTEGPLMSRIRHIVERSPQPLRPPRRLAALSALVPLTVVLGLGCLSQLDAETRSADTEPAAIVADAPPPALSNDPSDGAPALEIAWLPESVTRFESEIIAAAERHGVDPELVAIVVLVESRGKPDARSPVGARGLMQVMPGTADAIAEQRGIASHQESQLDDPAYNLDLGTWFLARQLETFGDGKEPNEAVSLAAAAYNAGPQRLQAALRGETELSDESTRYSTIVATLWSERDHPSSSLLD